MPGGITTGIASTPGACSKAATECSISVRPARTCNCLGLSPPNRCPIPPASTTATVRMLGPYLLLRLGHFEWPLRNAPCAVCAARGSPEVCLPLLRG